MKKITILTLFKESIIGYINSSIIKKAINEKLVDVEIIDFRQYSLNKHKKVDDYQYGGGAGMVLMLQPIIDCLKAIKTKDSWVVLLSAQGTTYNQLKAKQLIDKYNHIILICGHYEGFDERIVNYVNEIISIGNYILTGGELPAMVIADSMIRLVDQVISKDSLNHETFENNLHDYPVYTKPLDFEGHVVPDILLSGNHEEIEKWKHEQRIIKTKKNNLEMYQEYQKKGGKNA